MIEVSKDTEFYDDLKRAKKKFKKAHQFIFK
jgi:hypothetical protein